MQIAAPATQAQKKHRDMARQLRAYLLAVTRQHAPLTWDLFVPHSGVEPSRTVYGVHPRRRRELFTQTPYTLLLHRATPYLLRVSGTFE